MSNNLNTTPVLRVSKFDVYIRQRTYSALCTLLPAILSEYSLAYEWVEAYSSDTVIEASRLGWMLVITSAICGISLIQLLLVICWVPTNMHTRMRVTLGHQTSDENYIPPRQESSEDSCACCCRLGLSEYAPHVYQRRKERVQWIIALDSVLVPLLIGSAFMLNITRLIAYVALVVTLLTSFVFDWRLFEAYNFWFAAPADTDVSVLRGPHLKAEELRAGWRSLRIGVIIVTLVFLILFALQNYYLFGYQHTAIESKRLEAAGWSGYFESLRWGQSMRGLLLDEPSVNATLITATVGAPNSTVNASHALPPPLAPHQLPSPPPVPLRVWVWFWEGLPCEYLSPDIGADFTQECLKVFSPDAPGASWYAALMGSDPAFLGRQFAGVLGSPASTDSVRDTEARSEWQNDNTVEFSSGDSLSTLIMDTERAFARLRANDTFVVTRIRARAWKQAMDLFYQLLAYWKHPGRFCDTSGRFASFPLLLVVTASHSQSQDGLQRFGGIVPPADRARSRVPWFTLPIIPRVGCIPYRGANYTSLDTRTPRECVGTVADIYPTLQVLRLRPLNVYSTGEFIFSTVDRYMRMFALRNRDNVTLEYIAHLYRMREIFSHHVTFSIGAQSTEEIKGDAEREEAEEEEEKKDDPGELPLPPPPVAVAPTPPAPAANQSVSNSLIPTLTLHDLYLFYQAEFNRQLNSLRDRCVPIFIVRNLFTAILLAGTMFICLAGLVASRTVRLMDVGLCECFNIKQRRLLEHARFVNAVRQTDESTQASFIQTAACVLFVFFVSYMFYVFYYGIPLSQMDFSVLHVQGGIQGLLMGLAWFVFFPAIFICVFHWVEHYRLARSEDEPFTTQVGEQKQLLPISREIECAQKEEDNAIHGLTLIGYVLSAPVLTLICWGIQASSISPVALVNPSWFQLDTSLRVAFAAFVLQWALLAHWIAVCVRVVMYEPVWYCVIETPKSDSVHGATRGGGYGDATTHGVPNGRGNSEEEMLLEGLSVASRGDVGSASSGAKRGGGGDDEETITVQRSGQSLALHVKHSPGVGSSASWDVHHEAPEDGDLQSLNDIAPGLWNELYMLKCTVLQHS